MTHSVVDQSNWHNEDFILTNDFDSSEDKMFEKNNLFCFIDFATKQGKSLNIIQHSILGLSWAKEDQVINNNNNITVIN